jgi:hypothetical protein
MDLGAMSGIAKAAYFESIGVAAVIPAAIPIVSTERTGAAQTPCATSAVRGCLCLRTGRAL